MDGANSRHAAPIESLERRIAQRDYTVGVIGLGYVGLPLALRFGEAGFVDTRNAFGQRGLSGPQVERA